MAVGRALSLFGSPASAVSFAPGWLCIYAGSIKESFPLAVSGSLAPSFFLFRGR